MRRKDFIRSGLLLLPSPYLFSFDHARDSNPKDYIMTVNGPVASTAAGFTLSHEHIMVDFIGADKVDASRYNAADVYNKALPYVKDAAAKGCKTLVECTPDFLGRDPVLLQKISKASGVNIVTNTGFYGASKEKFVPQFAYTASAKQLAAMWTKEWKEGIGSSGIKPGYIKVGLDAYPLSEMQQKLVEAAALTHLATGLSFGVHTGDGKAALEELKIVQKTGVRPDAWVWIHAQSENNRAIHIQVAKAGGWVSFDGMSSDNVNQYLQFLKDMKAEKLLHKVLVSHDAGWYNVGEPNGGNYRGYEAIFTSLIPALKKEGFTTEDINMVFVINPATALSIQIRKT